MKTSSLTFSFIALITCIVSCTNDSKVDPVINSEPADSDYYACLIVTEQSEEPGICSQAGSEILAIKTDELFGESASTYNLQGPKRITQDTTTLSLPTSITKSSNIKSTLYQLNNQPSIAIQSPLKHSDGNNATVNFSPHFKANFIKVLELFQSKSQSKKHNKNDILSLIELSRYEPHQKGDISTLSSLVLGKEFDQHCHFLIKEKTLLKNKNTSDSKNLAKQLEKRLINLGKIRKEVEYARENQQQMLKLWKAELVPSFSNPPTSSQLKLTSKLDKAIEEGNAKIFLQALDDPSLDDSTRQQITQLKARKFIAISRPVEDIGYQRIAANFDGKPVNMKGKSSTATGFIPLNQLASKLPGRYREELITSDSNAGKYLDELRKYQDKSELGLRTIEPNFLPTSVAKPMIRETPLNDGTIRFEIAVMDKVNLKALNASEFKSTIDGLPEGGFKFLKVEDAFELTDVDTQKLQKEGIDFVAELIANHKNEGFEVLRHHANPATVPNGVNLSSEFRQLKFNEFKDSIVSIKQHLEDNAANKPSLKKLHESVGHKLSMETVKDLDEEGFIKTFGRENAEKLRSEFNQLKLNSPPYKSLSQEFAEFALKKTKGETTDLSPKAIELFYLGSKEISADVDTWGKAQQGTFKLDNFNYNTALAPLRDNFPSDEAYAVAQKAFEKALVRQDQYDVFIDYPIPPDLLKTGGVPTRLSKHFYEHLNTGFPQRLKDDYPLSIQIIEGGEVKIIKIEKGPENNIHGPFVEKLESFASEGIYMPLNPIDLIKNFSDYQAALPTAPNMSRFALKYFDDFALQTPKDQTIEQVVSKMGISSQDIDSAKQLYLTARQSIADNQDNLSAGLKPGNSDKFQAVTERLDRFFAL